MPLNEPTSVKVVLMKS